MSTPISPPITTPYLPYYPYRDVALPIWNAILGWTTDYVATVYATDDGPANDRQLQNWVAELTSHQGGRVKNVGVVVNGIEVIRTREQLAKVLAIIIFTASAQHSAVNFPQALIMSFAPAMPLAGYSPAPSAAPWLAILPPLDQALTQLNLGTLLGSVHKPLKTFSFGPAADSRRVNLPSIKGRRDRTDLRIQQKAYLLQVLNGHHAIAEFTAAVAAWGPLSFWRGWVLNILAWLYLLHRLR